MRAGVVVVIALLMSGTAVRAQDRVAGQGASTLVASVSPDEVVARLMSFDRNRDGRVATAELVERMHPIVTRGDTDGDGALSRAEVSVLATTNPAVTTGGRGFPTPTGYAFGDQIGLTSRAHIEGALDDLRLSSTTKERVLAVVNPYVVTVEERSKADLLQELKPLLNPGQYLDFKSTLGTQSPGTRQGSPNASGGMRTVVPGVQGAFVTRSAARPAGNLEQRIELYRLPAAESERAKAAVEQHKRRLRLGVAAERVDLLEQLKDILSDEERDDFAAALDRRPVVSTADANGFITFPDGRRLFVGSGTPGTVHTVTFKF
ncbi:MAG TPA: hypothetical protein VFV95_18595 [Vicinamibacterales bacterium]|nr:hypothetical protein [Vicinamibacterales bacterium]